MADAQQTCRYCGDTNVKTVLTAGGRVPLCERHATDLRNRYLADMDRVAGLPVANPSVDQADADRPAPAPEASPIAPTPVGE